MDIYILLIIIPWLLLAHLACGNVEASMPPNGGGVAIPVGDLTVLTFFDYNNNGIQEINEPHLGGVGFILSGVSGRNRGETHHLVTNAKGEAYELLPTGTYKITELTVPGWVSTTSSSQMVTVVQGESSIVMFGYFRPRIIDSNEITSEIKMETPVEFDNVTIVGDIDLSRLNMSKYNNKPILFSTINITNSEIKGNVNFKNATIMKRINFKGTTFDGFADFSGMYSQDQINFNNTTFLGYVSFSGSRFSSKASFNNISFNKSNFSNLNYEAANITAPQQSLLILETILTLIATAATVFGFGLKILRKPRGKKDG